MAKRCRLGLRVLGRGDDPLAACAAVEREFDDAEAERVRRLTVLPVSLVHDEYMFIRMLQCYEATFAFIAVQLRAAIDAPATAPRRRERAVAEQAMLEARPLWSLVATMQPEAFLDVPRVHRRRERDPVAQLQARREPVPRARTARLDSPAYRSVPEVRERVLAGQRFESAAAPLEPDARPRARRWSASNPPSHTGADSHYKLALKMLGSGAAPATPRACRI